MNLTESDVTVLLWPTPSLIHPDAQTLASGVVLLALAGLPTSINAKHALGKLSMSRHGYEDAKGDFESYLPKMSDRGIVLIHDTQVRERGFGVFKVWDEVSRNFPNFEFHHGFGLGVLAVGTTIPASMKFLFDASEPERDRIREFFHCVGAGLNAENSQRLLESANRSLEMERDAMAKKLRNWLNYGAIRSDLSKLLHRGPSVAAS